ncbi:MAG: DegV family protein [Actinomycetota bacterium]|nr:DegV family protein [Actinomycetota bacterium]
MDQIAIVTDSTADLGEGYYLEHNVTMVPLSVRFEKEFYKDWVEMGPEAFYAKLKASEVIPKTSQPTVAEFEKVFKELSKNHDRIISIHISGALSGTTQSAQIAAESAPAQVSVIDGRQGSLATGLLVDIAVRARDDGKCADEIVEMLKRAAAGITILFMVDTLKYLHLGGRIGKANALAGSLLNIKPILTLEDGVVTPFKKMKGAKKAMVEMVSELKSQIDQLRPYYLMLADADAFENISYLKGLIESEKLRPSRFIEGKIGPVIGTYVGPGAVALVFYQEPQS